MPGVTKDYTASLAATVTSSATAAELTVRDASTNHTGHLVNGASFLAQPLQVNAADAANPGIGVQAAERVAGTRVSLLAFPAPVSARPLTIGFKQSIAATESLITRRLRQGRGVHALGDHAVGDVAPARPLIRRPGG